MCEIAVKAWNSLNPDSVADRQCSKRGHAVVVRPDGWGWGLKESLPDFVLLKLPGVAVETAEKYTEPWWDPVDPERIYAYRLWRILLDDMPAAAIQKLATTGVLTIKVGTYNGPSDYTWNQVRRFFLNQRDNVTE